MKRALLITRTMVALGLASVARVAFYRLSLKLKFNPVLQLKAEAPGGPFFARVGAPAPSGSQSASTDWRDSALLFGHVPVKLDAQAPDWFVNRMTGKAMAGPLRPWWQIPDFDPAVGDIKGIWELSRMQWAPALAEQARRGDQQALARLNQWLNDWFQKNPPYLGPNWKCGQEASIRIMNLAVAALVLDQTSVTTPALGDAIRLHLKRIEPTISYAVGQDNNHGTSEAAALFIGGTWLDHLGDPQGAHWAKKGRKWLENRAAALIGEQGTFSQYSVNYHRLMLDTFSVAEIWRRRFARPAFTPGLQKKLRMAALWLRTMVDDESGDVPNIGANDGAQLLQTGGVGYRDFRPSTELSLALFANERAFADTQARTGLFELLGVPMPASGPAPKRSLQADDGGFAVLCTPQSAAILRYPRFRFRPSQADALHLDFWRRGENLLRDGGSYSYNTTPELIRYFGGARSHNTVEFDDRDQMPRLSRFLFGNWLTTSQLEPLREEDGAVHFGAGYVDAQGASHLRRVSLTDAGLQVTDEIAGFEKRAVLRWRLPSGNWVLSGHALSDGHNTLAVNSELAFRRFEIVEGLESRFYMQSSPLSVLEVELDQPGRLVTTVSWVS